jgi:hypothetical protein
VSHNPEKRRSWRFGKITTLYAHRYRLKFLPSAELNLAAAAAPPSPPPPKRKKKIVKSELTISVELIVKFIRKNVPPGNWKLFFDELRPVGYSILAMFERARPKSHERRPLNEAAQVIKECGPKEMPEEPWDHLYACLEWFVRWTQRVMPNALWQQAMQQGMKTLLPQGPMRTLDGR